MVRILLSILLIFSLGFYAASPARAQDDTEPLGWVSPSGPSGVFGSAYEACEAQWSKYMDNGYSRFIGVEAQTDDWRRVNCEWTRYQYLCPEENPGAGFLCGTVIPQTVEVRCPTNFLPSPDGLCRLNAASERPCGGACDPNGGEEGRVNPKVGNPVVLSTGAKVLSSVDYVSPDGLFRIGRHYRSYQVGKQIQQSVLPRDLPRGLDGYWNFDFNHEIQLGLFSGTPATPSATVAILMPDGTGYGFALQANGSWIESPTAGAGNASNNLKLEFVGSLPADLGTVRDSPSVWKLTDRDDTVWTIETRRGPNGGEYHFGWPTSMVMRSGYRQDFAYATDGSLATMTDSFGRTANFTWQTQAITTLASAPSGSKPVPARVSRIDLPDGTSLQYDYETTPPPPRAVYSGPKWPTTWFGGGTLATVRTVWSTLILRPSRLTRVERQSATNDLLDSVRYLHEDATYPRYITGIIDNRDERVATYQYDSAGRVILTEGADGTGTKAVAYSNPGTARVRKVTNDFGKEDTFTFSQFSASQKDYRLTSLSGAATADTPATAASLTYGSNTFISSTTDAEGRLTTMVRDARGRPTTIVEASGTPAARTTTITWHPNFNVPASIAIPGLTETRTYDAQGRLATVTLTDTTSHTVPYATAGQSRTSSFVWDANGRLLSVNGPLAATAAGDDITSFTYDTQGNLLTATNPLGQVVTYAGYGPDGRAGLVTDVNGVQTAFAYDALGRVLSVTLKHPTDPLQDTVTSMAYDAVGNVTAMTLPGTATLSFEYDAANRMTAMFAADGERWSFAYDEMDNVVSERVRRSDGTSFATIARAFDDLGRLIRVASGTDSAAAEWAYDKVGNVTATTSPNGFTTAASFDALDRVISTVAPDTGTSALSYDAQDNPLSFTDPIAVTTQFTYNGFGEVIQEVSPDRGTSTYWYDAAGQLVQASDGRGQVVIYERDLLGRMTKMTPVGRPASEVVTYTWDTGGITGSYRVGRLTRMVDGSGTTLFSYDHRGDLLIKRQVIGTSTSAQLSYAYDAAGRIIRITYPSGRQVRYGYDAKGRVASVDTRASGGTTAWTPVAGSTLYEPFGPVRAMLLGNGLAVGNVWGQDGSLASRQLTSAASGTDLSHLSYRYDADGNIGAITDHLNPAASVVYGYDPVGRLVLTVSDTAPVAAQSYSYTSGTNRLASFSDSSGTRTISYDARGNTVSETRPGGITVNAGYDGYGRLISYNRSNTGAQSYTYNGLDDRVRVDKPTGTRSFVYDADGRVMGEYGTSATDVKAEFIWALPSLAANDNSPFGGSDVIGGYTPLAVASPAGSGPGPVELFWVHGNHLGVPVVYTNASGTAVAPPGDYLLPGFPGQLRVMADLYYNRYRDYDPVTGRYIQADPIGLAGGANGYIYAGANPVNMIDPDGLSPQDWFESGQFFGIAMAADALGAANARNAGRGDVFCYDPWDVAFGFGASMVTGYGLGKLGKFLFSFRGNLPSGLGDLTRKEQEDIQRVVDRAGRPLDVVGSAARGKRRGRGADLPIGKGKDGKSDIDYVAPSNSHPYFRDFRENLPDLDPKHGIIPGPPDPHQGPSIRFEPGNKPRFVPGG